MNTINGSVEVQGTVHTVEFERVMNNFTESYLRVIESQFGIGIQSKVVEEVKLKVVKPKVVSKPSPIGTVLNKGFEKLKNPILKTELERCKSVDYDTSKFITIRELGIKSIYELDKRSKGFWNDYFFKGGVYLRKGLNTSRISQKILFDRVIEGLLKKKKLEPIDSSNSEEWREVFRKPKYKKREYVKGGKFSKVKGFDFYFNKKERLYPFQRKKLLKYSDSYISNLTDEEMKIVKFRERVDNSLVHLDYSHTDEELKDHWNLIYDKYGYRIPEFKEKWEREFVFNNVESINDINEEEESNNQDTPTVNKLLESLRKKKYNSEIDLG